MVSLFLYGNYSLKYLSEFFYYLYVILSEAKDLMRVNSFKDEKSYEVSQQHTFRR